jgi:hypothetical protein
MTFLPNGRVERTRMKSDLYQRARDLQAEFANSPHRHITG